MSTTHSIRRLARTGMLISGPLAVASLVLFAMLAVSNASASTGEPADETAGSVVLAVDDEEGVDVMGDTDGEPLAAGLPPITYGVVITSDPFEPVRPEPEPESADPSEPGDPTDPSTPTDPDDPDAPRPVAPDPEGPDDQRPVDQLAVTVLEVGDDSARVQVGDSIYDVDVGQVFAGRYVLDAIVGSCVRITDQASGRTQEVCVDETGFK